jgi:hypothetical protein
MLNKVAYFPLRVLYKLPVPEIGFQDKAVKYISTHKSLRYETSQARQRL